MKKIYDFKNGVNENEFFYCYGLAVKAYNKFILENNCCIRNEYNEDIHDFDYTSIISKDSYSVGTKIYTEFKFERRGAPLLVLGNDFRKNENGISLYGVHFEVIGFEDGCNVWYLIPREHDAQKPVEPVLIGKLRFPIPNLSVVKLSVELIPNGFSIEINGEKLTVIHPAISNDLHIGVTACEGINRFYTLQIEN